MKIFLLSVTMLLLILLELLAGNFRLPCSFPLYGALYFAVAYRKSYGIAGAAAAGIILDAIYGRNFLVMMLIFPAILLLVLPVVKRFRRQLPLAAVLPGGLCGGAATVCHRLWCRISGTEFPGPDFFSMLIFQFTLGALFMLLFTLTADMLAFKCNLPRFGNPARTGGRRDPHE